MQKNLDEAYELANVILNEHNNIKNPTYFKEKYWDQLKNII